MRARRLGLLALVVLVLPVAVASAQKPASDAPPAVAAGQVLVADGLAQSQFFDDLYGLGRRADAGYVITARRGLARWLWFNGFLPPAVRIEVTVTLLGGPTNTGFGLAFGRPNREATQWMSFMIAGDGHYKLVNYGGSSAVPWRLNAAVQRGVGARNRLAVEVRGHNITLFVNGVTVDAFYSDRDISGALATELTQGIEARYEDLRVFALDAGGAPVAVAPATPAAGGNSDLLFTDDFRGTPLIDDAIGRTEYAMNGLLATARQGMLNWMNGRTFPSHARITMTATLRGGASDGRYGIAFGRPSRDSNDWMELFVAADGSWFLYGYGEVLLQAKTSSPVVRAGFNAPNELRVDLQGNRVTAYVNGTLMGSYVTTREIVGYVGVDVAAGNQALFQNLRVERMP